MSSAAAAASPSRTRGLSGAQQQPQPQSASPSPSREQQLQSLALLDGENEVAFDLPGCPPPLRTQLFVWPPDARVVIFDIEGAITATGALKRGANVAGAVAPPTHGAQGVPLYLADGHAALLGADEANAFLSPLAFAKPFDALHGEVWVSDCDAMRVACWGAFMP